MLKCKVCNNPFDSSTKIPYILKCGHTFCKTCIDHSFDSKRLFACLNCFYISQEPSERIINQIINDRSSYIDAYRQPSKLFIGGVDNYTRQNDRFGSISKTDSTKSKGDMIIEQDAKARYIDRPVEHVDYTGGIGTGLKCRMKLCLNPAAVDGLCEKCVAGLASVKKLKATPLGGSFVSSPIKLGNHTPDRVVNSSNTLKTLNLGHLGSKSCRRVDKGLSTVKRISNSGPFDDGRCKNPSCTKPVNKGDPTALYCGYICRNLFECG